MDKWEGGYDLDTSDPYNTADARWNITDGTELDMGEVRTLNEPDNLVTGREEVDVGDRAYMSGDPQGHFLSGGN